MQDLFSLAIVLYEIFTKTITAATVIVLGTPHECSDYAFKVGDIHLGIATGLGNQKRSTSDMNLRGQSLESITAAMVIMA